MQSNDGKFEIFTHTTDDDSYFYSDTKYQYAVVSVETGDSLWEFTGSENDRRDSSSKTGVEDLSFSEDCKILLIKNYDSTAEERELPLNIEKVEEGKAIKITWPGGKVEVRPRKEAIFSTKSGQPFTAFKLK